jgi:hypothetical protein
MSTPKKFDISDDNGVTWFTFPGDTAEFQNNGNAINDTVFGANYQSNQPGMINWNMSANAFYKGFAGYVAKINQGGTPTAMTAEAMTLVSGKTYRVTNAVKSWWDYVAPGITVKDNGVAHNADVLSIDYVNGMVTFKAAYTVAGPVTVDGKYLPMTPIVKGQSFTLTQTANTIDLSSFDTAQANNGLKVFDYGLKTVSVDISGIYAITNGWFTSLTSRNNVYIEINPDGLGYGPTGSTARGIYKTVTQQQAGKVAELEVETLKFNLFVPDPSLVPLMLNPFGWNHGATSSLSIAIQKALNAWQVGVASPTLQFRYLYDGTNGRKGAGIVTDMTLTGGLEVMNTFAVKVQGTDALTVVGTG